jgi:hypothetical protein
MMDKWSEEKAEATIRKAIEVSLMTPAERAQAFRNWANSHKTGAPPLSDYAVSREAMYSRDEDEDDGPA